MCGLTAFLTLHPQSSGPHTSDQCNDPVNGGATGPGATIKHNKTVEEEIDDSLEIVKHRGPDARGQWISSDRRAGLGHVRLSIIDLSPDGNQPFHDSQDDVHAVVNGELYDFERYRTELQETYQFRGRSDCEIVLGLYKYHGLSFLQHLRGEFALVLYDARRQLFVSARDRYGIKSLYYTVHDGRLLIATEMKSFLAYGWRPEWNVQALREQAWRLDARTYFTGVYKIFPGQYLVCRQFGDIEQKKYWDLEYSDKEVLETRTEEEMIRGVRERLVEAVRLRLRADVPVGIYLSGGLDSSAVAGIVAHLVKEQGTKVGNDDSGGMSPLKCFCVQYPEESGMNESDVAQRTAEWLGVEMVPVYMDEEAIAAGFEAAAWHSETPLPDVNGVSRMAMSEVARSAGLKVVLTGEGSDEHFAGYSWLIEDRLMEPDRSWPALLPFELQREQASVTAFEQKLDVLWDSRFEGVPASTRRMLGNTKMCSNFALLTPMPFASWTDHYALSPSETVMAESLDGQIHHKMMNKWHPLHTSEYLWTRLSFPNTLLRYLGDNVDMVGHIESRTPFLDHPLTEYANGLPPSLKMKFDPETKTVREKHILREAVKTFVTEEVYQRRKQPFVGPFKYSAGGPFHQVIQKLVTKENVENLGFVDWSKVEGLAEKAFVEHVHSAFRRVLTVAQFVVISQGFGVKMARPTP